MYLFLFLHASRKIQKSGKIFIGLCLGRIEPKSCIRNVILKKVNNHAAGWNLELFIIVISTKEFNSVLPLKKAGKDDLASSGFSLKDMNNHKEGTS